jgi:thymidylate synthase
MQTARSALHARFSACKNLLTNETQSILLSRINKDVYNPKLSKTMDRIEKIVEQLKNNKNELVSTFANLALKSYYFQPCRSDVRKFIKAAK